MKRQIVLEVTFRAYVRGGNEYIPESTAAEDVVTLVISNMDSKYVVFPKLIEGATLNVVKSLQSNVSSYLNKQADEERKRREYAQLGLPYVPQSESEESDAEDDTDFDDAPDDEEGDASDDDEETETESEPTGIDFGRIAKEVGEQMKVDGFEVEVGQVAGEEREG